MYSTLYAFGKILAPSLYVFFWVSLKYTRDSGLFPPMLQRCFGFTKHFEIYAKDVCYKSAGFNIRCIIKQQVFYTFDKDIKKSCF